MRLEITIPCYNEAHRLEAGVAKLTAWILRHPQYAISVVLAENGSSDDTREIAQRLVTTATVPMRLVTVDEAGLGLALRAAWDSSDADIIGYCDADMATDLDHLDEVMKLFSQPEVTVVNGSRWLKKSIVTGRNFRRRIFSWLFRKAIHCLLRLRVTDTACGFKFFRRAWYEKKRERLFSEQFFLGAELLWHAEGDGVRVEEIPLRWTEQPGSRIRVFSAMLAYWRESRRLQR